MSTILIASTLPRDETRGLPKLAAVGLATFATIFGLITIWPTVQDLRGMWLGDDLKSIGMIVPLVSLVLLLRVWRSLGWEMAGTWWGFVVFAVTVLAVHLRQRAVLVFIASPRWAIYLPPHSLVVFAYGSALVLLFGGTRLYRAALFPILLLWLVNPVPHFFNVLVDLPLQHASALVARSFARALGQPLTPDQLRLMFTPDFGMFIAPGCNGIRGAVTMGLIALVAGYLYRFRPRSHAAIVVAAVLLGYVFNFVRLCALVIYYIVALHLPALQNHGELIDYYIGGALFLIGTMLLILAMRRLGRSASLILPPLPIGPETATPRNLVPRLAAVFALSVLCAVPYAEAVAAQPANPTSANPFAVNHFPGRVGVYKLTRTWSETLSDGVVLYQWGEYVPDDGGVHVSIGVSPELGAHDTLVCHSARGEDPVWHGQIALDSRVGTLDLSGAFFNDAGVQRLEASTLCNGSACGEFSSNLPHFGFVYSRPDPKTLFDKENRRSIPVLIVAETLDATLAPDAARAQLTRALERFAGASDMDAFTAPYRN